jgi:hypothetical protein
VVAACSFGLGLAGSMAAHARHRALAAMEGFRQVSHDLQELAELKARLDPRLAAASAQPLLNRMSAAAAQAGLPSNCVSSVSPEAQSSTTAGNGALVVQRRAAVTLGSLTLPQFGKLLEQWRKANTDWVITAIDINPASTPPPAAGGDLSLSVGLTLESVAIVDTAAGAGR